MNKVGKRRHTKRHFCFYGLQIGLETRLLGASQHVHLHKLNGYLATTIKYSRSIYRLTALLYALSLYFGLFSAFPAQQGHKEAKLWIILPTRMGLDPENLKYKEGDAWVNRPS